jgi:hypothetical protein
MTYIKTLIKVYNDKMLIEHNMSFKVFKHFVNQYI